MKTNRSLLLSELAELLFSYNITIVDAKFTEDTKDFSVFISGIKEDNIDD